jgi:hypothetical protein
VRVSWFGLKIKVGGFPYLGLKTGSCGLVIWPTKSPRQFSWFGPEKHVGYGFSVVPQN